MAENSAIEWTDHTFNPWLGCVKVSDGCKHCYAETLMDKRYGRVKWGPTGERVRTSPANWRKPYQWDKQAKAEGRRYRVFCASLADVFEAKPDQQGDLNRWRTDLGVMIENTPHLDWLLLTKRPENVNHLAQYMFDGGLPSNVWIGTSVENQEQADKRIPELLKIPAAVRFLSCEPLLGKILLDDGCNSWLSCRSDSPEYPEDDSNYEECCESYAVGGSHFHGIDWVIVGGESGPHARPMHPDWARAIRDQCQEAGVPFFFKQWGAYEPVTPLYEGRDDEMEDGRGDLVCMSSGGYVYQDYDGQPSDPNSWLMERVGKKAAGRILDGRTWDEFPLVEFQST